MSFFSKIRSLLTPGDRIKKMVEAALPVVPSAPSKPEVPVYDDGLKRIQDKEETFDFNWLDLEELTEEEVFGIYSTKDGVKGPLMPKRARYLEKAAKQKFIEADRALAAMKPGARLRVSDMRRSPESSRDARKRKNGVQPPAYSGHNFGFSIDTDTDWILKTMGWTKAQLNRFMEEHGWWCHRRDDKTGFESWHWNMLGPDSPHYIAMTKGGTGAWQNAVSAKIMDRYGSKFVLTPKQIQLHLRKLKMYSGEIDGSLGKLSVSAAQVFCKAWDLKWTSFDDRKFQRTLAFVCAELKNQK